MLHRREIMVREPALIALETLWVHKLRSVLTLLGVIIAVTALIGVISVVNGLNTYVAERLANFGVNVFYITRYPIITNAKEFLEARRHNRKFTHEDYQHVKDRITMADEIGVSEWRNKEVRAGNESLDEVAVRGTTANFIDIATDKIASGRFFTEGEYQRRLQVAFIGTDVAERLFSGLDPLGKVLLIDGASFLVIGVAEKNGSVFGQSADNFVYVPHTSLTKIWGEGPVNDQGLWIAVKCSSPGVMQQVKDQARSLMRARRKQSYGSPDRFGIIESESVTSLWNSIFGGLEKASIGIVSVFLVIGGVVIMNIMLATVTERTHEIGIRKALGARRSDIRMQFVVESSVMAGIGGILGVAIGLGVTKLVALTTSLPMRTPFSAVAIAVTLSTAVGLFFGLWPAVKASRLDPVVALRAE